VDKEPFFVAANTSADYSFLDTVCFAGGLVVVDAFLVVFFGGDSSKPSFS
jgi:hypothetical protein